MDMEQIKSVIGLMKEEGLDEFAIEEDGFKLSLKRRGAVVAAPAVAHAPAAPVAAPAPVAAAAPAPEEGLEKITSPLVGTFYRASSPEQDPFVKAGDRVTPDTVVCIIEAMKVMNEVKAGVTGVVRRVLAENGAVVEFGQPLFEVEEA